MDALCCQALCKQYGRHTALDGVNLHLAPGHIAGLLGPNGSGKTTLIKLAAGLLTPSGGQITVCGQAPSSHTKAQVAYLPDRTFLPEHSRVGECVNLFADFFADFDREKATSMLADLKLGAKMKLSAMSKGTLEKLQLALVMSRRAKLYLLDEPIGGVDPAARSYILSTIIQNYSPEAGMLISTHLIAEVETLLDDAYFLREGHVIMAGAADDIRQREGKGLDELFREVFAC